MKYICIVILIFVYCTSNAQITKERTEKGVYLSAPVYYPSPDRKVWSGFRWEYTYLKDGKIVKGVADKYYRYPGQSTKLWLPFDPYKVKVTYFSMSDTSNLPIYSITIDSSIIPLETIIKPVQ